MDQTTIPQKVQDLANSVELFQMCVKIGGEFGLNMDQISELDAQVRWILRGKAQTKTFSADIQPLLDITPDKARAITERINTDIFQILKALTDEHETETSLQAIEQAGDFEIERPASNIPVRKSLNLLEGDAASPEVTLESGPVEAASEPTEEKADIMEGIENPQPAPETPQKPLVVATPQIYPRKEPLVEQLLRGATAIPEQKVVREAPVMPSDLPIDAAKSSSLMAALAKPKPTPQAVPPRAPGTDPYREAI